MHDFNPRDRTTRCPERFESEHGTREAFHRAMVLFHDIIIAVFKCMRLRYRNGMGPYPKELRTRVVAAVEQGDLPIAEIATLFGVGMTFIKKMLRLHRAGADLAPRHGGGPEPKLQDRERALLCAA